MLLATLLDAPGPATPCLMGPSGRDIATFQASDLQYGGQQYLQMLFREADRGEWHASEGQHDPELLDGSTAEGWGQRYFGILFRDEAGMAAQIYDSQERHWLQAQLIVSDEDGWVHISQCTTVQFCDGEQLAAGLVNGVGPEAAIVIFGPAVASVSLAACPNQCAFRWLPGSLSLLVVGGGRMARLDLDVSSLPATPLLELQWVDVPAGVSCRISEMKIISSSAAAVVLRIINMDSRSVLPIHIARLNTAALVPFEDWSKGLLASPLPEGTTLVLAAKHFRPALHHSCARLAVGLGQEGTCLYKLLAGGSLGHGSWKLKGLTQCTFSACGYLLAGLCRGCDVAVVDAQTGAPLRLLRPVRLWSGRNLGRRVDTLGVTWISRGRLSVSANVWGEAGRFSEGSAEDTPDQALFLTCSFV